MKHASYGAINLGPNCPIVTIECGLSSGLPGTYIIGLASRAVEESRERLKAAFRASKLKYPSQKVVLSLAPAGLPKNDSGLDLGLAAAIILRTCPPNKDVSSLVLGELGLNGQVRPIKGCIGKLLAARDNGLKNAIVPYGNRIEASLVSGLSIFAVKNLTECYQILQGVSSLAPLEPRLLDSAAPPTRLIIDQIIGQESSKRALMIAIAGRHNLHLYGPPGTGKSMLAKAAHELLPNLDASAGLDALHLQSLRETPKLSASDSLRSSCLSVRPPLRSPHHSLTRSALLGGLANQPGELALANSGVLVLDEMPEFAPHILEALRQPLEDGYVSIAKSSQNFRYQTDIQLIATSNPCMCGYYGEPEGPNKCTCTGYEISRYQRRLSGPLLDRIDMHVAVTGSFKLKNITNSVSSSAESSGHKIMAQIARVHAELAKKGPLANNTSVYHDVGDLFNTSKSEPDAVELLSRAGDKLGLSSRSIIKVLKVAGTIAALDYRTVVTRTDVAESLQYRWRGF